MNVNPVTTLNIDASADASRFGVTNQSAKNGLRLWLAASCGIIVLIASVDIHTQLPQGAAAAGTRTQAAFASSVPISQRDAPRNRVWSIANGVILLSNGQTGAIVRRFSLPGWINLDDQFNCAPDLIVDAVGNVVVSSNIEPTLWRIDAQILDIERIEIALDSEGEKDFGFTALAFASPDELIALNTIEGSFWRIHLSARRASKLPLRRTTGGVCLPGLAN
jgi:hypothetical protein